jgi:proliferating cell nuclear antigen
MEELRQGIRGTESISDHVTLSLDSEGFRMHSEGETDKVDMLLPKDGLARLEVKEAVKSMYPLDFFSNMVKSITTSQEVTLHIGNEYPLKIEFAIANGKGDAKFLLAPRVEED